MQNAPVHTFRGTVRGLKGTEARFTIDDQKIEGLIITADEHYYVEPRRNYSEPTDGQPAAASSSDKTSSANDYVFYKGSDVVEGRRAPVPQRWTASSGLRSRGWPREPLTR